MDREWARSYARQALSDLRAREVLVDAGVERCHPLHFLQMAAEKTCKAHLIAANGHEHVRKSHAYVELNLPVIARQFYPLFNNSNTIPEWELDRIRALAREIELLAPACNEGESRVDNTEYPWQDAKGTICTPCDYKFANVEDRDTVRLIKLIRTAAESYAQ